MWLIDIDIQKLCHASDSKEFFFGRDVDCFIVEDTKFTYCQEVNSHVGIINGETQLP